MLTSQKAALSEKTEVIAKLATVNFGCSALWLTQCLF